MRFAETEVSYDPSTRNTILDYAVKINLLREEDRILSFGKIGNYSITGIEITFTRCWEDRGRVQAYHSRAPQEIRHQIAQ
jgi:hypothetical protein